MENRIKEQQLALFADRTSTQALRSNQLRLYFSSFAYVLIETLRALGLGGSELAQAQCDTIRLKLLKIGAQIRITVRNVWIAFSEAYPYASLFQAVAGPSATSRPSSHRLPLRELRVLLRVLERRQNGHLRDAPHPDDRRITDFSFA